MNYSPKSSHFERSFSTQQTFRRNKHYYNILQLNQREQDGQKQRRKPISNSMALSTKISSTFQSAQQTTRYQQDSDIQQFKMRLSFYQSANPSNPESPPSSPRGVPLNKMLSRQRLDQLNDRKKQCIDERQFNNFYITRNSLHQTPSIGNYSPRNGKIALEHFNDLYYDSKIPHEQCFFDNTTNGCTFRLNRQNHNKQRYFFIPKRQEDRPATDLEPKKVHHSFNQATPRRAHPGPAFYRNIGKQLPSQMDQRRLSPNQNFYKDKDGRLIREEESFTVRRYKDQMETRDKEELINSKEPHFLRKQICDEKYFKQEKRRMDKQKK